MSINPYISPQAVPLESTGTNVPERRVRPLRAFGRWTLICCISAAPSFFWGCALHQGADYVIGMLAGILVFVLGYTLLECTPHYQQIVTQPHVHRTALIGYGTRLLVSVIFPVGLAIDMLLGVVSISIVENVSPIRSVEFAEVGNAATGFTVFLTTIVQGVLLNVVVLVYMLCVYGVLVTIASVRERARQRKRAVRLELS